MANTYVYLAAVQISSNHMTITRVGDSVKIEVRGEWHLNSHTTRIRDAERCERCFASRRGCVPSCA